MFDRITYADIFLNVWFHISDRAYQRCHKRPDSLFQMKCEKCVRNAWERPKGHLWCLFKFSMRVCPSSRHPTQRYAYSSFGKTELSATLENVNIWRLFPPNFHNIRNVKSRDWMLASDLDMTHGWTMSWFELNDILPESLSLFEPVFSEATWVMSWIKLMPGKNT